MGEIVSEKSKKIKLISLTEKKVTIVLHVSRDRR